MTVIEVGGWLLVALTFILGIRAILTPVRFQEEPLSPNDRLLVALYEAARAGFWFSLTVLFAIFALVEESDSFRVLAVVPVVLAGIRMLAAVRLARR